VAQMLRNPISRKLHFSIDGHSPVGLIRVTLITDYKTAPQ